jgi:molybdopterin/thiamine biosynthesis adenylyltransferase
MANLYDNMISRQIEIFTKNEQQLLKDTPVVVMGCGGLGGTVIEQLTRSGFEHLTIIDQDVFDETNLNRQIRSNTETINKSKVATTKKEMEKINPNVNITSYDMNVNQDNVAEVLKGNKILIDATDNVYTRVVISRESKKQGMAFVHGAVEKTTGQISVFEPNSVTYEELFKLKSANKDLDDDVTEYLLNISSKKPQVLGTTASIFAALQVNETIKYILNKDNVVIAPKVLMGDAFNILSFRLIDF